MNFHETETQIKHELQNNPHSMQEVYRDLDKLRNSESLSAFHADLKKLNGQLEKEGLLPNLKIVTSPDAHNGFRLEAAHHKKQGQNSRSGKTSQPGEGGAMPAGAGAGVGGGMPSDGGSGGGGGSGATSGDEAPTSSPESEGDGTDDASGAAAPSTTGAEGSGLEASGPNSFSNYDSNTSDMSSSQDKAVSEANADAAAHKEMWTNFPAADAEEGCAASVSQVLDDAHVAHLTPDQGDAMVSTMQADLQKQGWTVTDKPQPGDVVCGYGGLSSAHTGIVGTNGTVYDNHSSTGQFSQDQLSYFSNWDQVTFLKPPDASNDAIASAKSEAHSPAPSSQAKPEPPSAAKPEPAAPTKSEPPAPAPKPEPAASVKPEPPAPAKPAPTASVKT